MVLVLTLLLLLEVTAAFFIVRGFISKTSLLAFKENEKEEQMRLQQEMLARRKNKGKMKEYFENVEKKREATSQTMSKNNWARSNNSQDPLEKWKQAKEKGDIKQIGYDAAPPKSSSLLGINIVLPLSPIDIAKYDEGERFDLRLPYAERGYEDPDADVLGKLGQAFGNLFGKKKPQATPETTDKSGKIKK